MPIRLRLTLWYGLLLGLTLLVFCVALYLALRTALERDFDEILRVRAAQVERELLSNARSEDGELSSIQIQPEDLEPVALEELGGSDVYVQVLSPRGEVLATSGTTLPVAPELVAQAVGRGEAFETLVLTGQNRLRSLYRAVGEDQVIAVVQVAETLDLIEDTMRDARTLMLGGALALLAAALGSGWALTGRALAPVTAITEAAAHIARTGRFDRRLASASPRDELGALAATFDVMIARLEQIVTQQRQLLADTSHELRNPLSVIRGNLDFVRRVTTDQSCLESIHEAEVEAVRMSRLVNDLLLLAQADAGEFIERRPVRLDAVLRGIVEQAGLFAEGQLVELHDAVECWVEGDQDRLRQLFWNLVENALRYTPPGGRIDIRLRSSGSEVAVEVADGGPGVPAGQEERVFERFYRADASRARATGGAGLGLAIVKHVAEAHDGHVALVNRPGDGATFLVTLPLMTPPEDRPAQGQPIHAGQAASHHSAA